MAVLVGKPFKAVPETEDGSNTVVMKKAQHDGPDHVVESRADASAGDNAALELGGVKEDLVPGPCKLESRWGLALFDPCLHALQRGMVEDLFILAR